MLRLMIVSSMSLVTSACGALDSAQVQDCERQLLDKLKSPSSYKRVSASGIAIPAEGKHPRYYSVDIKYDADNSYGAAIRDTEICMYRIDAQGRPTVEPIEIDYAADAASMADNLEAAADNVAVAHSFNKNETEESAPPLDQDTDANVELGRENWQGE